MKKLIMLVYALLAFSSVDAFSMQFEGLITSNVLIQTGNSNFNLLTYSKESLNQNRQVFDDDSSKRINPFVAITERPSQQTSPPDSPEALARLAEREAKDGIVKHSLGLDPNGSKIPANYSPEKLKDALRGETAYGNDLGSNNFYSVDVSNCITTSIGTASYEAFGGDFRNLEVDQMYIIDYNDDWLKTVDITTGVATPVVHLPCPMAPNGIWTELAIDKGDDTFYMTASNMSVSNLYKINPVTGEIILIGNTGVSAIISCTIDLMGIMYALDIVSDNIYTIDLETGIGTVLGPAGFNANYAQGMGYDVMNDIVYLAAYSTFAELRTLDRTTGATSSFCSLPGETGAFGFPCYICISPAIDVGVQSFLSPVSGPGLGEEIVTLRIKNFGSDTQSNILVSYTLDGGPPVTGIVPGPIAEGEMVDFTFPGTVNMGNIGQTYVFEGCTFLEGDENPENDCKTHYVTNLIPAYCDASTQVEDEYIANVQCGNINNSSGWQGGVADYTNISTTIPLGTYEEIIVTNGNAWANDIVYCWADWDQDFEFEEGNELFMLTNVGGMGETFTGIIHAPPDTPEGQYRFRIRMTYSTAPQPCGEATYGEVEDYTIILGTCPPVIPGPTVLNGTFVPPNSAYLAWFYGGGNGEWIQHCGSNDGGMGLEDGGTFYVSAFWDAAMLSNYNGFYMTKASIFPTSTDNASYELMVWTDENGGTLLVSQPLTGLVMDEWNDIGLTFPVEIIPENNLWVGYKVTHNNGDNPAGLDDGPAVAGYGDMVSLDGVTWESIMISYGLDFNFTIKAFVTDDIDGQTAQPLPNHGFNNQTHQSNFVFEKRTENPSQDKARLTFLGHNIYRDDVLVGFATVMQETYIDSNLYPGIYSYTVRALYDVGLSEPAGPAIVEVPAPPPAPVIQIEPMSLEETHPNPPMITSKIVTVTNTGDGTLNWDLTVNINPYPNQTSPPDSPEALARLADRQARDGVVKHSLGLDPNGSKVPANYSPEKLKEALRGEIAYGNDIENNTFYSIDMGTGGGTVISPASFVAFGGDFAPGDVSNMYIIDYNDDWLKTVDIVTGQATPVVSLPCPMAPNGLWTELAIDKNDGTFYMTATDINQSNLYKIDPESGEIILVGNTGIAALISCTIDLQGIMYALDIVTDNICTIDLETGVGTVLGPAGFNANYAQGMGYDAVNDIVYLAAYSTYASLMVLDKATGATTFLGLLPGETGAFGFPYSGGPQPANDVGVQSFLHPVSGPDLGYENVTIQVKNFGLDTQSNIPVSYTLDGGTPVTGIVPGPIAAGETADYTFQGVVNLSNLGQTYVFEGCTFLEGDENPENDSKTHYVTNLLPDYCGASTQVEDEYIANVLCGDIDNSSGWQGGVADYTDISTMIDAGTSEEITVTNGNAWASDIVYCWVDWDKDFEFVGGSELYMLNNVGGTGQIFTGSIYVPSDTQLGEYRLRIRMTYSTAPQPCGEATYGEVEDYTITVEIVNPNPWLSAVPITGTLDPGQSSDITVTFNTNYLPPEVYAGLLTFTSNDPVNPVVDVPAILTCGGTTGPVINVNPESFYFLLSQNQTETQFITITNGGDESLLCNMGITFGTETPPVTSFDVDGYRRISSNANLSAEAAPETIPANVITTSDAIWDLQFTAPCGDGSGEAGIETETQGLVDWLSVPEDPFYVTPNSTISVSVICNTEDLPENLFYYASIWIANNSINNPMVEVPVTLELITGIDDSSGDSYILMYPNPTFDFVNIKTNSNISQVRIFNQAGQMVHFENVNGNDVKINTSGLPPGNYIVEITTGEGTSTQKLILK